MNISHFLSAPIDSARIAPIRGAFKDGYTPDEVTSVLSFIQQVTGICLVMVWERCSPTGFAGNSELGVYFGGHFYACDDLGGLEGFLDGTGDCPATLVTKLGEILPLTVNGGHNCAWAMAL